MIDKIKNELREQKKSKFKGNLYHVSQINFSYNSNKIEGSRLTIEQTEAIFDAKSFIVKNEELIKLDDLIETRNHFKLFDYMIDNFENNLTKEMILEMNVILKSGTSDQDDLKYNIEGFKIIPNVIGSVNMIKTTSPNDVTKELDNLLNKYLKIKDIKLEDIINFHFKFERIHPFSDGNGRIGRIIMFKECLKNNIMPFIISDIDKYYYLNGLKEYPNTKGYLIDICKKSQDDYEKIVKQLIEEKI